MKLSVLLREDGVERLLESYRPRLCGFFISRGVKGEEVMDLVQDTMLKLLRWPPAAEVFEPSVFRAAESVLVDRWRRRPRSPVSLEEVSEEGATEDPSGEILLRADLENSLLALPSLHREVLLLAAEGCTDVESAALLGISAQKVGRVLRRVRLKLIRQLRRAGG